MESVSLPELHQILMDYINRDEEEVVQLEAERKERSWRKAEGKTKRELELEQQKIEELGEYRSGFGELVSRRARAGSPPVPSPSSALTTDRLKRLPHVVQNCPTSLYRRTSSSAVNGSTPSGQTRTPA